MDIQSQPNPQPQKKIPSSPPPPPVPPRPPINIDEGFFYVARPADFAELESFLQRLLEFREIALNEPIRLPHVLKVTGQRDFSPLVMSSQKRVVPPVLLENKPPKLKTLLFELTDRVQVGAGHWSQTWKGTVSLDPPEQEFPPFPIFVKIYQESLFPAYPEDLTFTSDDTLTGWRPGGYISAMEAWAFDQMREIQGINVPWSYGFYKFLLPSGEPAFGHVMEYIDAMSLEDMEKTVLNDDEMWHLADNLCRAIHGMHSCGVLHCDLEPRNVLVFKDSQADDIRNYLDTVLIDFGFCRVRADDPMDSFSADDVTGLWILITEAFGVSRPRSDAWYEARRREAPSWRTMFAKIDQERDEPEPDDPEYLERKKKVDEEIVFLRAYLSKGLEER